MVASYQTLMSDAPLPTPTPPLRKPRKKRIPERWDIFASHVAAGENYSDAYRKAYSCSNATRETIKTEASKLARREEVAAMIARYKREEIQGVLLSRDERLAILGQIAKSKTAKPSEKVSAITAYTKIVGDAAPERQELTGANGGPITTAASFVNLSVQDRAKALMEQLDEDKP